MLNAAEGKVKNQKTKKEKDENPDIILYALYEAINKGDSDLAKDLLTKNLRISRTQLEDLKQAINENNLILAKRLLEGIMETKKKEKETENLKKAIKKLCEAINKGNLDLIQELITKEEVTANQIITITNKGSVTVLLQNNEIRSNFVDGGLLTFKQQTSHVGEGDEKKQFKTHKKGTTSKVTSLLDLASDLLNSEETVEQKDKRKAIHLLLQEKLTDRDLLGRKQKEMRGEGSMNEFFQTGGNGEGFLSDHMPQIAKITMKGTDGFKPVSINMMTSNMLGSCVGDGERKNNPFNISENTGEYLARLNKKAKYICKLIEGQKLSVVCLQEAPTGKNLDMFKLQHGDFLSDWEFIPSKQGALLTMFDRKTLTKEEGSSIENIDKDGGTGKFQGLTFSVKGCVDKLQLTNVHLGYVEALTGDLHKDEEQRKKGNKIKDRIDEIISPKDGVVSVMMGDFNSNSIGGFNGDDDKIIVNSVNSPIGISNTGKLSDSRTKQLLAYSGFLCHNKKDLGQDILEILPSPRFEKDDNGKFSIQGNFGDSKQAPDSKLAECEASHSSVSPECFT